MSYSKLQIAVFSLTFVSTAGVTTAMLNTPSAAERATASAGSQNHNPYSLSISPEGHDWNFTGEIRAYQDQTPSRATDYFKQLGDAALSEPAGVAFIQDVPDRAAVEITKVIAPVPFAKFVESFPPAFWGTKLAHRLGGEIRVLEVDPGGRPVRQVERMVLSSLPFDPSLFWLNQDMTKLEQIVYEQDRAVVYWKVIFSDNGSTEMDLGSLEFSAHTADSTLLTFHSAHRLRMFGVPLSSRLVAPVIRNTFKDHLAAYLKQLGLK